MKAIVQEHYGPPARVLRLRDVPKPVTGPGQVLVRVATTSVHADVWHAVTGVPYVLRLLGSGVRAPKNPIPGTDLAGEVVAVGPGVVRFELGDRVFGEITRINQWGNAGAFAQYAAVDVDRLAVVPASLSLREAAAVPSSALIALGTLREGNLRSGGRVLVNGAGGAVGVFAVQLAKAFGAEVTAVDFTPKLDLLRSLGADHVVDANEQDFTASGERYDVVLDIVSVAPFSQVRRVLQPDGRFVLVGHDQYGRSGHRWLGSLGRMLPLMAASPFVEQLPGIRSDRPRAENLATIVGLLEEGKIRPVVDERVFALPTVVQAIEYITDGQAQGRVVVTVAEG